MAYWRDNKDGEIINGLCICGCFTPTIAYQAIHEVLKLVKEKQDDSSKKKFEEWCTFLNDPYKTYTVYVLNELRPEYNGEMLPSYLEHGSSICGSWLSETGERLLEIMNEAWDPEAEEYDFEDHDSQIYEDKYQEYFEG